MNLLKRNRNSALNRGDIFNYDIPFIGHIQHFVSFLLPFICTFVGSKSPFIQPIKPRLDTSCRIGDFDKIPSAAPIKDCLILSKFRGFTLTELVITLAIGGILTATALPSFRGYIQNTRLVTSTNEYLTAINLARSEAITRNTNVRVCASSDATTAVAPSCAGNWQDGWIMFNDCDGDGAYDTAASDTSCTASSVAVGETLMRVGEGLPVAGSVIDDDGVSFVEFLPSGLFNGDGNSFEICIDGMTTGRQIAISTVGQTTISFFSC